MPPLDRNTLPTIASSRQLGMTRLHVQCANLHCKHQARLAFDALRMADSVIFIEIPRSRRFRCTACGHRRVEVWPDWTEVRAYGDGKTPIG